MAGWYGDPEVKAWMKGHPGEVSRIEKLYGVLKGMRVEVLEELALELGLDTSKRWTQFRDGLITDIVKASPEKALEIVSGQGVLLTSKESSTNKGD